MPLNLNALLLSIDRKLILSAPVAMFTIGGSDIEIVDSWHHLGHVICCRLNDNLDIQHCHNNLVAQVNSVLCNFVSMRSLK